MVMIRIYYTFLSACIMVGSILVLIPPAVQAQSYSISIAPHTYQVIIKPGSKVTVPLEITNSGDPTIIKLEPFLMQTSSSGVTELVPYSTDTPTDPLITLGDSESPINIPVLVNTHDSIEADITIAVPAETTEKEFPFVIVAQAVDSEGFQSSSAIRLQGSTAARIIVSTSPTGNLDSNVEVVLFDASPRINIPFIGSSLALVTQPKSMKLHVVLINTGTQTTQVYGKIGTTTYGITHLSQEYELPSLLLMGNEQREMTVNQPLPHMWFGKVDLRSQIYEGANPQPLSVHKTVYVIPVSLTIAGGSVILISILMYILTKYAKT